MRNRSWRVGLVCAAALLGAGSVRGAVEDPPLVVGPPPAKVEAVRSIAELRKSEPVTAGKATVKVGVETATLTLGQGALVYCLWDGKGGDQRGGWSMRGGEKMLGPLKVRFEPRQRDLKQIAQYYGQVHHERGRGESLYVLGLVPQSAGTWDLKFYSREGDLLAKATLEVAAPKKDREVHPWRELQQAHAGGKVLRPGEPALPKWEGVMEAGSLPTFIPDAADTSLKLTRSGNSVRLDASDGLVQGVERHVLVRVYVNGKAPAEPLARQPVRQQQQQVVMDGRVPKSLSFELPGGPEAFGAAAGDRVELEFLVCHCGTEPVPGQKFREMTWYMPRFGVPVRKTARLTWIEGK